MKPKSKFLATCFSLIFISCSQGGGTVSGVKSTDSSQNSSVLESDSIAETPTDSTGTSSVITVPGSAVGTVVTTNVTVT